MQVFSMAKRRWYILIPALVFGLVLSYVYGTIVAGQTGETLGGGCGGTNGDYFPNVYQCSCREDTPEEWWDGCRCRIVPMAMVIRTTDEEAKILLSVEPAADWGSWFYPQKRFGGPQGTPLYIVYWVKPLGFTAFRVPL